MAIVIQEQKKPIDWFTIVAVIVFLCLIGAGVYFVFFAATPAIEIIIPTKLQLTSEIARVKLDPAGVVNNPTFQILKTYTGLPSTGSLGRQNPFIAF